MITRKNAIAGLTLALLGALMGSFIFEHDAGAQTQKTAVCESALEKDKMASWITAQLAAGKTSVVGGGGYSKFFYCAW